MPKAPIEACIRLLQRKDTAGAKQCYPIWFNPSRLQVFWTPVQAKHVPQWEGNAENTLQESKLIKEGRHLFEIKILGKNAAQSEK